MIEQEPKILVPRATETFYFERLADLCILRRSYLTKYFEIPDLYQTLNRAMAEKLIGYATFGTWRMLASMGYQEAATDMIKYYEEFSYGKR